MCSVIMFNEHTKSYTDTKYYHCSDTLEIEYKTFINKDVMPL